MRFQFCEISEYMCNEFICADTYTCPESIRLNIQDNAEKPSLNTAVATVCRERLHMNGVRPTLILRERNVAQPTCCYHLAVSDANKTAAFISG